MEEIRALAATRSPGEMFSWKSPQARARGIKAGTLSDEELLRLMAEEPRLIRRPLLRIGAELVIGADLARIRGLLERSG